MKFVKDDALNFDVIKEILGRRFPEYELDTNILGNLVIKKNSFVKYSIAIRDKKDRKTKVEYTNVVILHENSGCLMVLTGYIFYFVIQLLTKGTFYTDIPQVLEEELSRKFQLID